MVGQGRDSRAVQPAHGLQLFQQRRRDELSRVAAGHDAIVPEDDGLAVDVAEVVHRRVPARCIRGALSAAAGVRGTGGAGGGFIATDAPVSKMHAVPAGTLNSTRFGMLSRLIPTPLSCRKASEPKISAGRAPSL